MKYVDHTFASPAENLACDQALLDRCEAGFDDEILRFWEPQDPFVVLGYANRAAVEADLRACRDRGIGVFRRCSGGGTVLQGPGCLNYALVLRIVENGPLQGIAMANQFILQRLRNALQRRLRIPVAIRGLTDLVLDRRKFSGNAQRRHRKFLIFHGTFLLNFDLELLAEVLPLPSRQPDYRENRPHLDFLTNLNVPAEEVKQALGEEWKATEPLGKLPLEEIGELTRTRYANPEWIMRL